MRRTNYKKTDTPIDKWLASILALRLRQLEQDYPNQDVFSEKSGISRATMNALRHGRGNPTLRTLNTLAKAYDVTVWSLLGIREESVRGDVASFGLDYDSLAEMLQKKTDEMERGRPRKVPSEPKTKPARRAKPERPVKAREPGRVG